MPEMSLHDPFEHLKHKLWPKERPGVKLAIWLLTNKSQESPWFPCMRVACHISLERSRQGLQFFFRPHLNQRFAHKVMKAPKSRKTQLWEFQDSHLGVPGQNAIWMWASWRGTKYTIRGKVVASPKSGLWWVLWVRVCPWLVLALKVLKLCTNQLVV
jgi:hypothetical protein